MERLRPQFDLASGPAQCAAGKIEGQVRECMDAGPIRHGPALRVARTLMKVSSFLHDSVALLPQAVPIDRTGRQSQERSHDSPPRTRTSRCLWNETGPRI